MDQVSAPAQTNSSSSGLLPQKLGLKDVAAAREMAMGTPDDGFYKTEDAIDIPLDVAADEVEAEDIQKPEVRQASKQTQQVVSKKQNKEKAPEEIAKGDQPEVVYKDPEFGDITLDHVQRLIKERKEFIRGVNDQFEKVSQLAKSVKQKSQQLEQFQERFKSDPSSILQEYGIDPIEFSQQNLKEYVRMSEMTPEQREAHAIKLENQRLKQEHQQYQQSQQKQIEDFYAKQFEQKYQQEIIQALEATGFPKDANDIAEVAKLMHQYRENDVPVPAEFVAQRVKENNANKAKDLITGMNDKQLQGFLGKDLIAKISKIAANQLTAQQVFKAPAQEPQVTPGERSADRPSPANPIGWSQLWKMKKEGVI